METLQKISAFLNKYRWAITLGLFVCCIMQQCTITTLRDEIHFLKDKYELQVDNYTPSQSADSTMVTVDQDSNISTSTEAEAEATARNRFWVCVMIVILSIFGLWLFYANYSSSWPFGTSVKGKLWQDLNGRVIFTLTVKNLGKKEVTVGNAIIEFIAFKQQRKFKAPVTDFPITLSKGTAHSVNIPIQKLIEQHRDLMDYKAIRMCVECNGKKKRTLPLGVKWKTA